LLKGQKRSSGARKRGIRKLRGVTSAKRRTEGKNSKKSVHGNESQRKVSLHYLKSGREIKKERANSKRPKKIESMRFYTRKRNYFVPKSRRTSALNKIVFT